MQASPSNPRQAFFSVNTIQQLGQLLGVQACEPTWGAGHVIADPMGLGKTLTMIALAAPDLSLDEMQCYRLEKAGIGCLRFDGKVPQKDRNGIIERFKTDPSKRNEFWYSHFHAELLGEFI